MKKKKGSADVALAGRANYYQTVILSGSHGFVIDVEGGGNGVYAPHSARLILRYCVLRPYELGFG